MARKRPIKVLMSKPGLDGHDRGVKVLTLALRDAGFEVIYTGLRQTTDSVVKAAIEEDVDVVGISCMTGNHYILSKEIAEKLKEKGADDILVILGGIIPADDVPRVKAAGVKAVFGPGSTTEEIVKFIEENVRDI